MKQGQADTKARKVEICQRAYKILVEQVGFPPEDIIFDPNIFAVATGIEEHNNYGVDFIEATREIKRTLPYALISGGVPMFHFRFAATIPCAKPSMRYFCIMLFKQACTWALSTPGNWRFMMTFPRIYVSG